tara:strand:- start:326 stop:466 length:141 start_codon:yes stop_codon:yes gene_type:complete
LIVRTLRQDFSHLPPTVLATDVPQVESVNAATQQEWKADMLHRVWK